MKRVILRDFLLVGIMMCFGSMMAQDNCYEKYLSEGRSALARQSFGKALISFRNARGCDNLPIDNPISMLIQQTLLQEREFLQKLNVRIAELSTQARLLARRESEALAAVSKADRDVTKATIEKNRARQEATEAARNAAVARMVALAEVESALNRYKNALALSGLALYLSDDSESTNTGLSKENIRTTFADVVHDSLSVTFPAAGDIKSFTVRGSMLYINSENVLDRVNLQGVEPATSRAVAKQLLFASEQLCVSTLPESNDLLLWSENEQTLLKGHANSVMACVQLSDGKLVTADRDGQVILWSVVGYPLAKNNNRRSSIYQLAVSPNPSSFYSRAADGTVTLWSIGGNALTGKEVSPPDGYVYTMATSAKGMTYGTSTGAVVAQKQGETVFGSHGQLPITEVKPTNISTADFLTVGLDSDLVGWSAEGEETLRLSSPSPTLGVSDFVENTLVSFSGTEALYHWTAEGKFKDSIVAHATPVVQVVVDSITGTVVSLDKEGNGVVYNNKLEVEGRFTGFPGSDQLAIGGSPTKIFFIDPDGSSVRSVPLASEYWRRNKRNILKLLKGQLVEQFGLIDWLPIQ